MKIKKYVLVPVLLFLSFALMRGQEPMALYFMETIPQSSHLNPAMQPRANGFFALPSVNNLLQSDLAFSDVFQEQGGDRVSFLSQRFNYDDFYKATGKATNLNHVINVDVLGLGFRSGRNYFSFTASIKNVLQMGIPADLFKIPQLGFPNGESYDFSPLSIKQAAYHELAFGFSHQWNDQWTFGVKLKPVFGIVGSVSDIHEFELNTSRTQWDIAVDGTVYTSAPLDMEQTEPGEFPDTFDGRELEDDAPLQYLTSLQNGGLAFDFGAVYEYDDNWTFSAALTNLGSVKFKNDLNSLSFKGSYLFDGGKKEGFNDNLDTLVNDILDSLETALSYDVKHDNFSVPITPSMLVGASYQFTPAVSFGLLSRSLFQKYNFRQDFNLSANIQPYSFVAFNLNYGKRINGGSGLGTGVSLLLGPLQFYLAGDYIPVRFNPVAIDDGDMVSIPARHKDISLRFGLNLIFGRHGHQDKPMLPLN
jgi:hypothetical protein